MFTGLVQAVGRVERLEPVSGGLRVGVDPGGWGHRPERGASISVSGCCLTVDREVGADGLLWFVAVAETQAVTRLGGLEVGDRVNLEHALRADALLGGHIVQGHVDGLGDVRRVESGADWRVRIETPAGLMRYVTPKGSVCVDGVSLTVAGLDVDARWFEVALIPETLARTTLDGVRAGDRVHLEMDVIAKTIVHHLTHYGGGALGLGPQTGPGS